MIQTLTCACWIYDECLIDATGIAEIGAVGGGGVEGAAVGMGAAAGAAAAAGGGGAAAAGGGAAAAGGGAAAGSAAGFAAAGAAALAAPGLMLHILAPGETVAPSSINNSVIVPAHGELTGTEVWNFYNKKIKITLLI